ncbi:MAG: hypothetical protein J6A89_00515 [Clostridia bacterium]|nr:hypothetical protein [Clostridia bacterium]
MKKEDFKYGYQEYYIEDKYVFESKEYLIIINKDIFDEETVEYANGIIEKYIKEKDQILDVMLKIHLRDFYSSVYNYSDEYIKNNIGRPQIKIDFKKDDSHPNWKFQYAGIIDFCESKLDEHIISIEFVDDLKLDEHVQMNG